MLFIK